jgi:citrate lyase subunit beta/citryl-CoA lyase
VPLVPAIETARGVLAAAEDRRRPRGRHLSLGGLDLLRDLYAGEGNLPMLYVRSHLVVVSAGVRAAAAGRQRLSADRRRRGPARRGRVRPLAGLRGQVGDPPAPDLDPERGLRPSAQDVAWARSVVEAFDAAGHGACRLPDGEFIDLPVAQRAHRLLELAGESA